MTPRIRLLLVLLATGLLALPADAGRPPLTRLDPGPASTFAANARETAASRDTVVLLGGLDGRFQDAAGAPAWGGWTPVDPLASPSRWHVSTYGAENLDPDHDPNHALWCGADYPSCGAGDPPGGYGNDWHEILEYRVTLAPSRSEVDTLELEAVYEADYEECPPWEDDGCDQVLIYWRVDPDDDTEPVIHDDVAHAGGDDLYDVWLLEAPPGEYELSVQIVVISDGRWSDADCGYPSDGFIRVDNIGVRRNGALIGGHVETSEPGHPSLWTPVPYAGVGTFGHQSSGLSELDSCRYNASPQVTFVNDGVVEPGLPAADCVSWCYGPGGHIVDPQGGLAGPETALRNEVRSPVVAWPATAYDGAVLRFSVYGHEPLLADSPGISHYWRVRSTASSDPADLALAPWRDRGFAYYGGPAYTPVTVALDDLLVPDRRWVQVALGVQEYGQRWGHDGVDGTPAPYLDDVEILAYGTSGPAMHAAAADLAQDQFPDRGAVDPADPAANHVRFDMARAVGRRPDGRNAFGDSIVCRVAVTRPGAVLDGPPRLIYDLRANPVYDPYRTVPTSGTVAGDSVHNEHGQPIDGLFCFDLPDTGLLYPGDELRYYLTATQTGPGAGASTLPADTAGFAAFAARSPFPEAFVVRALPTVQAHGPAVVQPPILVWEDGGDQGRREAWLAALDQLGYVAGVDYDLFVTSCPSAGLGNGLGGVTGFDGVAGYRSLLYAGGGGLRYGWGDGTWENDPGRDISLLYTWLGDPSYRNLLVTGDNVVSELTRSPGGAAIVSQQLGLTLVDADLASLAPALAQPRVDRVGGNLVFPAPLAFDLRVCCPGPRRTFDAVVTSGSHQLLRFVDEAGDPAGPYAAGAMAILPSGNIAITLPYDLGAVVNRPGGAVDDVAMRTRVLGDVLAAFDHPPSGQPIAAPPPSPPARIDRAAPNPFNPATTITFALPRPGPVSLRVYDLRGRLVRVLVDEALPAGEHAARWRGDDQAGRPVAAGVYLCRAVVPGLRRNLELTLVK